MSRRIGFDMIRRKRDNGGLPFRFFYFVENEKKKRKKEKSRIIIRTKNDKYRLNAF